MPKTQTALRRQGFPPSEYQTSLLHEGVLLLALTLTQVKRPKEAVAAGLMQRGKVRDALIEYRRAAESCKTDGDRAKHEPVASFKRGECFRLLKQDAEAAVAYQEVFRKYPKHELAQRAAFEAVR